MLTYIFNLVAIYLPGSISTGLSIHTQLIHFFCHTSFMHFLGILNLNYSKRHFCYFATILVSNQNRDSDATMLKISMGKNNNITFFITHIHCLKNLYIIVTLIILHTTSHFHHISSTCNLKHKHNQCYHDVILEAPKSNITLKIK